MSRCRISVCIYLCSGYCKTFCKNRDNLYKVLRNTGVVSGADQCDGKVNGSCVFTISQDICVAVPVEFGAVASVGDTYVNCNGASAADICTDCHTPVVPEV